MLNKRWISIDVQDDGFDFDLSIESALQQAESELIELNETMTSIKSLKTGCDKLDYVLAASSGALCGIIDIFLVGTPKDSAFIDVSDKWFEDITKNFAKVCKWDNQKNDSLSSAIRFLEKTFKVPYDQTGIGESGRIVFNLTPKNHHFKSLAHHPSILGLFCSIIGQFKMKSYFVSDGDFIAHNPKNVEFMLKGNNFVSKIFLGFVNWIGHIISDISGSSGSKTRGMGIPSPFWSWVNDIIVIKRKLGIPASDFNKLINDLALEIYEQGFDMRFQSVQFIPVIINELLVRLIYSIRRLVKYCIDEPNGEKSLKLLWEKCKPFSNPAIKRMLTVAHGTFCLIDIGDVTIRGFTSGAGTFNPVEFLLRLNIVGIGRFTISLYGEGTRVLKSKSQYKFLEKEKIILEDYIDGLKILSELYNDKDLLLFIEDFKNSNAYKNGFEKTIKLAQLRNVPEKNILKSKKDIDDYFLGNRR